MICYTCNHAEVLHDVWGVCDYIGCKPCNEESPCPRCGHYFIEHMRSRKEIACWVEGCQFVTCYTQEAPDKPVRKSGVAPTRDPDKPVIPYKKHNPVQKGWSA